VVQQTVRRLQLIITSKEWISNSLISKLTGRYYLEKILWEGEFTLRSDPWAGLIASCGSFYPMVRFFFREALMLTDLWLPFISLFFLGSWSIIECRDSLSYKSCYRLTSRSSEDSNNRSIAWISSLDRTGRFMTLSTHERIQASSLSFSISKLLSANNP
jgi:hypothetical protein